MRTLFFILISLSLSAQTIKIQTVNQTNPITKEVYSFPKFVGTPSVVAQKMNNAMRLDLLTETQNVSDADMFKDVWMTKDKAMAQLSDISYEQIALNSTVVCIAISAEGCGAYCEGFTRYFLFNPKTGNQLKLDSIFTKQGLDFVLKTINDYKATTIKDQLKLINDSLKSPKTNDKERFTDMKNMYTDCLQYKLDREDVSWTQFFVRNGVLTIIMQRCSPHALMALDELWEFKYELNLKEVGKLLSKYGTKLIK
jgi:hypothetical protein